MTSQHEGFSKCRDCKKIKEVNLDDQCFDCWNFKRHVELNQQLKKQWRKP